MAEMAELSESLGDYLEAIFQIVACKKAVRAKDISERIGVNRSSVTAALHALAQRGLINYAPYDVITLTESGQAAAGELVRRHAGLKDFFVNVLGVGEREADEAACRVEHALTSDITDRFLLFVEGVTHG
ncbi:MAG: metal-dependent transcriptional regulator [Planctomycetota bacterium]|nr:metal-dependent transcriptional regulator [Planctomycetota bacterium]